MSSGTLVSELSGSADKVDKPDVYVDVPLNRGVQNSRMGNTGMTSNITAAIPEYEERNETDDQGHGENKEIAPLEQRGIDTHRLGEPVTTSL